MAGPLVLVPRATGWNTEGACVLIPPDDGERLIIKP